MLCRLLPAIVSANNNSNWPKRSIHSKCFLHDRVPAKHQIIRADLHMQRLFCVTTSLRKKRHRTDANRMEIDVWPIINPIQSNAACHLDTCAIIFYTNHHRNRNHLRHAICEWKLQSSCMPGNTSHPTLEHENPKHINPKQRKYSRVKCVNEETPNENKKNKMWKTRKNSALRNGTTARRQP